MQSLLFELAAGRLHCVQCIIIHYTVGTPYKQRQQEKASAKEGAAIPHCYNRDSAVERARDDVLQQENLDLTALR